ncbi:MAG: biotin transporter BioY [Desulfobacterales bacterium]|nr:biotin transporter BioY [Deltaproteobacteria bacterium]NNL75715.1 biotin transporter BioY [Desulfobacterales bacterium]
MNASNQLRMTVFASLCAALMAVGAFIAIPLGPVPIVLQNMFVFLAGLLLGSRWGLASVAVYLLAGAAGLPVFAGGMGGIGRIVGPTGGYLIGYLPAVFIIGAISRQGAERVGYDIVAMICGTMVLYAFGVSWLKTLTGMTWSKTLAAGMYPFLVGDALKIVAAAWIVKALRPIVKKGFRN